MRAGDVLDAAMTEFAAQYRFARRHHVLPHAGGRNDQQAGFILAMDIVDEEIDRIERARQAQERNRKR